MKKIEDRYKGTRYLKGKKVIKEAEGSAEEILPMERKNIRDNPGPDNKEIWRGKKK